MAKVCGRKSANGKVVCTRPVLREFSGFFESIFFGIAAFRRRIFSDVGRVECNRENVLRPAIIRKPR